MYAISIHLTVLRESLSSLPGNPMVTLEEGLRVITEKVLMSTLASDSPTRKSERGKTGFEENPPIRYSSQGPFHVLSI